jgi:hypothetical protein
MMILKTLLELIEKFRRGGKSELERLRERLSEPERQELDRLLKLERDREDEEDETEAARVRDLARQQEQQRLDQQDAERKLNDFDEYTRTGIPPSNSAIKNPNKFDNNWFCDGSFFEQGGTIICTRDGKPFAYFSDITNTFHRYRDEYGGRAGSVIYHYDIFGENLFRTRSKSETTAWSP